MEVTLNLEISNTEPEHRQFVQATSDLFWERQQSGEMVQLHVQTVPVAFGWIGLHRRRLHTLKITHKTSECFNCAVQCLTIYNTWWIFHLYIKWEFLVQSRFFISCNKLMQLIWMSVCVNTEDLDVILTLPVHDNNVSVEKVLSLSDMMLVAAKINPEPHQVTFQLPGFESQQRLNNRFILLLIQEWKVLRFSCYFWVLNF